MFAVRRLCMTTMILAALAATASAQTKLAPPVPGAAGTPATPPPPVGNEPATTTASYGDWTVRCESLQVSGKPRRICEVVQTMQVQGQQAPVAQVAFGRPEGSTDLHLIAVVPVNVQFPSTVRVGSDDKDTHPLELVWRRCLPGGCFADAVASDDVLGRWRPLTTQGRLQFKDAAGRDAVLPLSFRGLAQALDALPKP